MDAEIDELLRRGEIDQAAALARQRGLTRRAAELLALAGRYAEGVMVAMESNEWRVGLDLALASADDRIIAALCDDIGKRGDIAAAAAAQARVAHRIDVAARLLEPSDPLGAAQTWYEVSEYSRAGRCFDRANDGAQAIRAFEQHLAQTPEDVEIAVRLAELRAVRGDAEGAVRALQSALSVRGDANAMRKLIDGLSRLGLDGGARAIIKRLRVIDPTASLDVKDYSGALPSSDGAEKRYAGRYRVVREVGSGASGRVLEAVDELSGETVALKVLTVGDDRGGAFGRFMREAELAQVLDDPTLVKMRALDPEGPTIVYDWMPGGTLAERIGTLTVPEVRAISSRLLSALETLHRHGVVHRDLKPSNVLFDPAGQCRLGDLGAAHLGDLGATVTGGLVGSLPYMAPEQITGAPVSAATDLYAFGCVFYQMLTGQLPFPGPDFVTQHLSQPIPLVSDARPGLGFEYDQPVASMLAKDPLGRPSQAVEARRQLLTLSWRQPDDTIGTAAARAASVPVAAGTESTRLAPSQTEGLWTDTLLARDIRLVRVSLAKRNLVTRWAAANFSDLQAIYELHEDGDDVVAWTQPIDGETVAVRDLEPIARLRIHSALVSIGINEAKIDDIVIVRSIAFGTVVPLEILNSVDTG